MRRLLVVIVTLVGLLAAWPGLAQPTAAPSPEELRSLAELLRDPAIQAWLEAQAGQAQAPAQPAASEPEAAHHAMASQVDATRAFLRGLVAALPQLPGELAGAWRTLAGDMQQHGA